MKTLFNSTYSKGRVNLRIKRQVVVATSQMDEVPFSVELVIGAYHSFYNILLEAIDDVDPAVNKKKKRKKLIRGF